MFFVDDLVMSPFKGFLFIAKEVAKAVEQQKEQDRADVMSQLSGLHAKLESGEIDEDEFDSLESELLDRLEQF
jgi:hypothetical protein